MKSIAGYTARVQRDRGAHHPGRTGAGHCVGLHGASVDFWRCETAGTLYRRDADTYQSTCRLDYYL